MGFTIFIGVLVFLAMLAMLHFGYEEAEKERAGRTAPEALGAQGNPTGRSADELVLLIERRIDSDLQDVAFALRRTAAGPRRA